MWSFSFNITQIEVKTRYKIVGKALTSGWDKQRNLDNAAKKRDILPKNAALEGFTSYKDFNWEL